MTLEEINILGDVINTTWGKSSTNNNKGSVFSSCKVGFLGQPLEGDIQIILTSSSISTFGTVEEREREMKKLSNDSDSVLDACLKKTKDDFKAKSGRTLKVKKVGDPSEDWTLLSLGQFSGRRDFLFQKKIVVEVA